MSPLPRRLLQTQSDARLLALARGGNERPFEALVQRYRKPLLRYCQRMLLSESRAEDAVQQAWFSAWRALQDGVEVKDARAWLYRIVHNAAVSTLRKSGYDYCELSESLRGIDAPHDDLERRIAVRQALAGVAALPELQREVLLRTAVEGESHDEVARSLGLTDGAVRGLVYRARATVRSAATVLTPPPLAAWAASSSGTPVAQRLAESAGIGSAGLTGALVKGGAVALTAGTLVTGAVLSRPAHSARAASSQPGRSGGGQMSGDTSGGQGAVRASGPLHGSGPFGAGGLYRGSGSRPGAPRPAAVIFGGGSQPGAGRPSGDVAPGRGGNGAGGSGPARVELASGDRQGARGDGGQGGGGHGGADHGGGRDSSGGADHGGSASSGGGGTSTGSGDSGHGGSSSGSGSSGGGTSGGSDGGGGGSSGGPGPSTGSGSGDPLSSGDQKGPSGQGTGRQGSSDGSGSGPGP